MTPFNPDTWQDYALLAFLGVLGLLGTTVPAVLAANNLRKHGRTIGAIKEQVQNSHDTNLRDDIDNISRLVSEGFRHNRIDLLGLREEIRTERLERIEGDRVHHVTIETVPQGEATRKNDNPEPTAS